MKEYYIKEAIKEAKKSKKNDEIPVGAVIVDAEGNIIGRGNNNREKTNYSIAHAEINAITDANKNINNWRLNNCTMYVTLEPCEMCKKVIEESRIEKVYYSSNNYNLKSNKNIKYKKISNELINAETDKLINESFKKIRTK